MKCEYCNEEVINELNGPYCCTDHKEIILLREENKRLKEIIYKNSSEPNELLCSAKGIDSTCGNCGNFSEVYDE